MTNTSCCCGCSTVRKGAWLIALINIVVFLLLMIETISKLNFFLSIKNKKNFADDFFNNHSVNHDHYSQSLEHDFGIFCKLFIIFLFLYVNFNLKKATYMHNVQSINQWLVTYFIFLIFFMLYIGFSVIKYDSTTLLPIWIPILVMLSYQLYVVKCFYTDELNFLNIAEHSIVTQPNCHIPSHVSMSNQTVPNPAYPVQAGPFVIQQLYQPVPQPTYPQQAYSCQPLQHSSHPHTAMHMPEQQPHEYSNPPPYSPTYNTEEGPSAKH